MRSLPPRTILPHMPRLAAMVTHHLPSLTRTLGLQTLCSTPTCALACVTRLRSTRCWCGTLVTPQIPLGKSFHTNNHLHHESTNKIHKCPRVMNLTKFGQSLPYSGNSTQNTTCAILIHHSHWAHLSIKYFQYYPTIFLFTI